LITDNKMNAILNIKTNMNHLWTTSVIFAKKLILIVCAFLLPIAPVLIAVGMFIIADTIIGIWKSKKLKRDITSRKLSRVIYKMFVYQIVTITFFCLDYAIIHDFTVLMFNIDFALTKIVAIILISIEAYSIDESFKLATGKGLFERAKDLIVKYKDVKSDINELNTPKE